MQTVTARRAVKALQYTGTPESAAALVAANPAVHMGFCAEHNQECPHLGKGEEGNVAIEAGSWLIEDGDVLSVMSDADFRAQYAV